jgi:RNA polymerase sigma-70 factor (ECF subfamily)
LAEAARARFDRLLETFGPSIRRTAALYERDPARREDLAQDICLALWQALPRFRGESSERTFVFRVAHNRGATHAWRRRRSVTEPLEAADEPRDDSESAEDHLARRENSLALAQAVLALPVGLRQVTTLALEGLAPREIADVLGLTENNVGVRLTRARAALRTMLAGRAGRPPATRGEPT